MTGPGMTEVLLVVMVETTVVVGTKGVPLGGVKVEPGGQVLTVVVVTSVVTGVGHTEETDTVMEEVYVVGETEGVLRV